MKVDIPGGIVVTMTAQQAHALLRALTVQALNAREENERPVVELYRALNEALCGVVFDPNPWRPK